MEPLGQLLSENKPSTETVIATGLAGLPLLGLFLGRKKIGDYLDASLTRWELPRPGRSLQSTRNICVASVCRALLTL
jgi:hypothetical protein